MTTDEIISEILKKRGVETPEQREEFFHPAHPRDIPSPFDSKPAIDLINSHIQKNNPIAIYGDYDVDGICSTAILWETLHTQYEKVFPHIPHRRTEGYGLSIAGIDHCLSQGAKLIITVDNGITAIDQVKYCQEKGCDIIIIDHHEAGSQIPDTKYQIHNTSCCATGLTWLFCRDYFLHCHPDQAQRAEGSLDFARDDKLELAAMATICDQVPLIGTNRSFAKYGLEDLNHTTRPGLLALFEEAGLTQDTKYKILNTYAVGFVIGPRLNAAGRLEHAIDSLRLLCTKNLDRARELAKTLGDTNRSRQELTEEAVAHAIDHLAIQPSTNLLVASSDTYDEGIIGLIAAKLVEKFHRPAVAIAIGPETSKGSARSIPGFHITDHLRKYADLLLGVGGHAAAAGFSLRTENLEIFSKAIANPEIAPDLLVKKQRYDLEIPLSVLSFELLVRLKSLEPFGLGNPKPVFLTKDVEVKNPKKIGKSQNHLKFFAGSLEAILFNIPDTKYEIPDTANIIYSLDENTWNGETKLQLLVKEIKTPSVQAEGVDN